MNGPGLLELIGALPTTDRGCRLWPGRLDPHGYGRLRGGVFAHRASWSTFSGRAIPSGLFIMHSCDEPACVEPSHLSLGTAGDNNRDRARKGRSAIGERSGRAKLTDDDVRLILWFTVFCGFSARWLGSAFDVDHAAIRAIQLGKTWRHIHRPDMAWVAEEIAASEALDAGGAR